MATHTSDSLAHGHNQSPRENAGDPLVQQYLRSHQRSLEAHRTASGHFAAHGATHAVRVADPFRPYITHAAGSRKWDLDGNEYIDYAVGHGALLLGHGHPAVVDAVQEQASRGVHFGENHELELRWAALIAGMMPIAERIEFCAAGQEANLLAMRLARIHTGRRRVLRFARNYHGWADGLVALGAPGSVTAEITEVPFNDRAAIERELATESYALLLTEGGGAHMSGQVPIDLQLQRDLPELAGKHGTLYCVDEVVTGFRDAPGGWQELVGIKPDLASIGKCAGGGLPMGALVGRAELFEPLSPASPAERLVIHAGTWNANPLAAAAGVAACSLYRSGEPQQQAHHAARLFRAKGNEMLKRLGVSARLHGRSIVHLYLGPVEREQYDADFAGPSTNVDWLEGVAYAAVARRLRLHLLQRGIAALRGGLYVFSAAHTAEDVDTTVSALEQSLVAMTEEGTLPTELQ